MKRFQTFLKTILCGTFVSITVVSSAQSSITFDSAYFSKYEKNFIPYSKETAPSYVIEPRVHFHNYVYPQLHYCVLDSINLPYDARGILYALSDSPVNKENPYYIYYLAVFETVNGQRTATPNSVKLVERNASNYTSVADYKTSVLEGTCIQTTNSDGSVFIQQLYQGIITINPIVIDPIIPPMDVYPPCIVPPWWEINPELWRCALIPITVNLSSRTLVVEPEPTFDAKQFIKDETKYHFYRSALRIPYGTYHSRQSYAEYGLYVLSDAILTSKLKEISETIKENEKT